MTTLYVAAKSGHDQMLEDFTLPHIFQVDSTGLQAHFADSRWTPGAFYFGGSPTKFMCIIHLEFT